MCYTCTYELMLLSLIQYNLVLIYTIVIMSLITQLSIILFSLIRICWCLLHINYLLRHIK